ncbi:MAG TPA: BTAD domain-containing putative transcriptional regulator [Ilumatobacteraceae bacterium]|nr:BTAD domain-containing putative transcriptional regulator [Ilumatobacteraceae bacterium]
MKIGLLGELQVLDDDEKDIVVTGAKLRALLVMLALQCGRAVPTDQLVDALWGPDSSSAARNGLQGLVSKLRRALGSPDLVATRGGGYALEVPQDAVDVYRFEQLVASGRARFGSGDLDAAIRLLAEGDALWRGSALAEFAYEDFASAEVTRISELRLDAVEERLDIELQLGRHRGVIGELEALVATHPLRERLRGLLMIALYRAGRQADALRIFQEGRRILGEDLGLDPGPELRRLETAILSHDPSLDVPASAVPEQGVSSGNRSTIPASLTPLVGRDDEFRDLTQLFRDHRFITLVGPGGVGKTRLAIEVARDESARLSHGACLVELAHVGDPQGVAAAIASALDLPDPNRLAEMIGNRDLLIVLDNCEHVITTAAELAEELLRRCPSLRLLATSREGLRVGGETIWPVGPLATDDAVQLFVERARSAGATLEMTDDVSAAVSDICVRLDGLPLAIELAAARTRAFPIQQISSRLNDRFRLLTGGSRTALPRQQTLRAVVDWSYELLFDDEQRVFERLSVFLGGCDLATVEAVCADEKLDASDLGDIIQTLVDKSLVVAVPRGDDVRFTQLQTLAHYGREKLTERGDAERIRDAMAAHYSRLCARSATAYAGDEQGAWLIAVDQEHDNLRAALDWAVANDDAETALTIAGGVSWPHWLAGNAAETKRWLDDAFRCNGDVSELARALALTGRGLIEFQVGKPESVDADLGAALAIFRELDDIPGISLAHSFYAEVAAARGDIDEGRRRRLALLDHYLGLPDTTFVIAARAYSRAKLGGLDGDLEVSERCYREAADGFSRIDRPMMLAMCRGIIADFDERAGDFRAAIDNLDAAIATNETLGLRGFNGSLSARLGLALLQYGDIARAEVAYDRALDLARRLSNMSVVFLALAGRSVVHRLDGRNSSAAEAAIEALDLYLAGEPRRLANRVDPRADLLAGAAVCCTELGILAIEAGDVEHAVQLLGQAERLRSDAGVSVPGFECDGLERAVEVASSLLGPVAYQVAFDLGRAGQLGSSVMFRR